MSQDQPTQTERGWDAAALRDPHQQPDKAARVAAMFDAIAPTYERVNRVATFGRDARWRARAVAAVRPAPGDVVLDICCGTGDMLRALGRAQPAAKLLVGVDFSGGMLAHAELADGPPMRLVRADALRLPLADARVDALTCAFGVRNFDRVQVGLDEMGRVARRGARVAILEFANPENALLRAVFGWYCDIVLPRVGAWISRDRVGAYRYLPRSIRTFETARSMCARLEAAGFRDVAAEPMNLGGVVLYRGVRA